MYPNNLGEIEAGDFTVHQGSGFGKVGRLEAAVFISGGEGSSH